MLILQYILVTVEVICSLLLIALILVQKSKSEGMGLAFGSGMGEALFGSRAGNVLTKLTIVFASVFLINTLLLSIVYASGRGRTLMDRSGAIPAQAPVQQQQAPDGAAPLQQPAPVQPQAFDAQPFAGETPVAEPQQAPEVPVEPASEPAPAVPDDREE